MKASARLRALGGIALLAIAAGCSTEHFRKSADKEVYGVIQAKSPLVQGMDTRFTIEQTNGVSWEGFPTSTNVEAFLGPDGERERGAHVLSLGDALKTAIRCSRSYQSQKEQLYLSALALTLARHEFTPIFSGSGTIDVNYPSSAITDYYYDPLTDEVKPIYTDNLVELHSGAGVRADWLIRDVGRITAGFTADVLRFVAGDPRWITSSRLTATFARPLLRNAGFKLEMENLTQAERQLLYDIRDFVRYRKDFSVQVATAYYGVLGTRDAVRNSYLNLQSSRKNADRSRALAQEGRITQSDLGRLEQQEFSAEGSWVNEVRAYQQRLDNFKIQLGLDPDAQLVLDDRELEVLRIHHPVLQVEESIEVALAARLDYLNAKDELVDTERKLTLAANFLKPRVDLVASATMDSEPNKSNLAWPDPDYLQLNAGLSLDPALDRKAERNAYASALLNRNRAAREVAQQEADIKFEVRDSWRTLDQAKRSYEISEIGVKLAERRVEEQNLLAELGRAKAQDQVDAQNDLINSKNQRTQALVTHTIARLQFWNNLGILLHQRERSMGGDQGWQRPVTVFSRLSRVNRAGGWSWPPFSRSRPGHLEARQQSSGNTPMFAARRGPLEITVLEGGSLQALESQEIKCEVRVGYQGTKILKIVEEGYFVTEDDVKTNKVLVRTGLFRYGKANRAAGDLVPVRSGQPDQCAAKLRNPGQSECERHQGCGAKSPFRSHGFRQVPRRLGHGKNCRGNRPGSVACPRRHQRCGADDARAGGGVGETSPCRPRNARTHGRRGTPHGSRNGCDGVHHQRGWRISHRSAGRAH